MDLICFRRVTQKLGMDVLTRWGDSIMLSLVVLVAFVVINLVMVGTKLERAVLAFERQEIDEMTVFSGTLITDS